MRALAVISGLAMLGCWIWVLIKIFQDKEKNGTLHGVIGILCGIWAFIWGWMNAGRLGIKSTMIAWSVAWVVYLAFGGGAIIDMMKGVGPK